MYSQVLVAVLICFHLHPSVASRTGKFWQITDIHLDANYSEKGNVKSECHGNSSSSIGRYGNFSCDAPWLLVEAAVKAMVAIESNPDFILWTGDSTAHLKESELQWEKVYGNLKRITDLLMTAFPNITIIPVIGNHDAYPSNNFPSVNVKSMYQGYLSKANWNSLIPPEETQSFHRGGYYKRDLSSSLRVLVLNTNVYLSYNTNHTSEADPTGQFAWLRKELKLAQEQKVYVIITAHVPPGYFERMAVIPFMRNVFNDFYVNLLLNYSNIILTQVYGHTHTDSFRLFHSTSRSGLRTPKTHAFIAPSVSPWSIPLTGMNGINPSIRMYTYSQDDRMVLDYEQYYLNLTEANSAAALGHDVSSDSIKKRSKAEMSLETATKPLSWKDDSVSFSPENVNVTSDTEEVFADSNSTVMQNGKVNSSLAISSENVEKDSLQGESSIQWLLLYRATEFYDVQNLSLSSLRHIYTEIASNKTMFERYYEMNTAGVPGLKCDPACFLTQICAISSLKTSSMEKCFNESFASFDPLQNQGKLTTENTPFLTTDNIEPVTLSSTVDSTKRKKHHVSRYLTHVLVGVSISLVVVFIVIAAFFVRRQRFRASYAYQRHIAVQS